MTSWDRKKLTVFELLKTSLGPSAKTRAPKLRLIILPKSKSFPWQGPFPSHPPRSVFFPTVTGPERGELPSPCNILALLFLHFAFCYWCSDPAHLERFHWSLYKALKEFGSNILFVYNLKYFYDLLLTGLTKRQWKFSFQ